MQIDEKMPSSIIVSSSSSAITNHPQTSTTSSFTSESIENVLVNGDNHISSSSPANENFSATKDHRDTGTKEVLNTKTINQSNQAIHSDCKKLNNGFASLGINSTDPASTTSAKNAWNDGTGKLIRKINSPAISTALPASESSLKDCKSNEIGEKFFHYFQHSCSTENLTIRIESSKVTLPLSLILRGEILMSAVSSFRCSMRL